MKKMNFGKPAILVLSIFLLLAGFFIFAKDDNAAPPPASDYAPNIWFDRDEQYYPVNPLDFYFENGLEITGDIAVSKYNSLSFGEKFNNLTVFYHIKDYGNQWVYQYWLFYVFNDYPRAAKNKHYGDWEAIFVFVDKESKKINKAIGTAHQRKLFDTEIYNPQTNHVWAYIGNGSHATCVDENPDARCDSFRLLRGGIKMGIRLNMTSIT